MSAWIEINLTCYRSRQKHVALFVSAWIEISMDVETCKRPVVALFVSAWIEIAAPLAVLKLCDASHSL